MNESDFWLASQLDADTEMGNSAGEKVDLKCQRALSHKSMKSARLRSCRKYTEEEASDTPVSVLSTGPPSPPRVAFQSCMQG